MYQLLTHFSRLGRRCLFNTILRTFIRPLIPQMRIRTCHAYIIIYIHENGVEN